MKERIYKNMNNKMKIALIGVSILTLASGCSNKQRISIEDSVTYAKSIYENRKSMEEDSFSASYLELSKGWYTSVDVRFQQGKYAYFSAKHYTSSSDPSNVTRNDFFLFSNVAASTDSEGSIVDLEEQYIFAVNTMSVRRQYNVIDKTRFLTLLNLFENENRAQFNKMEDVAYDYLNRYDGSVSPISFASESVAYSPSGSESDLVLEGGDTRSYQSYFDSVYFGESIHELRDYTDVYSEYHRFKDGRPYEIADSFSQNKIASSSYKAAFTYGNCVIVNWNAEQYKRTETELEFNPSFALTITQAEE